MLKTGCVNYACIQSHNYNFLCIGYFPSRNKTVTDPCSGVAKDGPGWACARPTFINSLPKSLIGPVNGIRHSIKTVSSSIVPTQLIQPGYANGSMQSVD